MKIQTILTPYFLDQELEGLKCLAKEDWLINQPHDLEGETTLEVMARLHKPLARLVAETIEKGRIPVSVAGDCCTSIAVLAGLQRATVQPRLIWFDAHGDFNTWETTPSGFLGGMPLAMIVGRGEQRLVKAVGLQNLAEDRVILTDGRDLDPGEAISLANSKVLHLRNVEALLEEALPEGELYVHFDTDVLDPEAAGAMNYLAPGGVSVETLEMVFRRLADSGQTAAVSMSSWNPKLDKDKKSEKVCMQLLGALTGE